MCETKIVVKKLNPHESSVIEGFPPKPSVEEGIKICRDLNEMATLAANIHPEDKEFHYLGEAGKTDFKLDS